MKTPIPLTIETPQPIVSELLNAILMNQGGKILAYDLLEKAIPD